MGGLLSGRKAGGGRRKAEACRAIDILSLCRDGVLRDGWQGSTRWRRNGDDVASVGLIGGQNCIRLVYRIQRHSPVWESVSQEIPITWRPCRFGGQRPFFACPGCQRRVLKIYGADKLFLCRHCYGLTFASRSEDRVDRAQRKAYRSRQKLAPGADTPQHYAPRPKGMWRRTHKKHVERIIEAETLLDERFDAAARAVVEFEKRFVKGFWS